MRVARRHFGASMELWILALARATLAPEQACVSICQSSIGIKAAYFRADWELNAAAHNRDAIRDQIYQEVRVSLQQLEQAHSNLRILENDMLPKLNDAIQNCAEGIRGRRYRLLASASNNLTVPGRACKNLAGAS